MSIPKGIFGSSDVVLDGMENGMKKYVMRPSRPPYIETEVIDGIGSVSVARTGMNERFWAEHLVGQGGDPAERASKGRRNTNRVIVAVLNGPGALSGDRLQAERRKHGYEVVPNAHGYVSTVGGKDAQGREMMGRGIKVIDPTSEIALRRADMDQEMSGKRAARMAQKMDTVNAAAALLNRGAAVQTAPPSAELAEMRARMAELEAKLAAQTAPVAVVAPMPEATQSVDDDDAPAPAPTRRGRG